MTYPPRPLRSPTFALRVLGLCMMLGFSHLASALPEGASVSAGDVTITGAGSSSLTVVQTSNKASINWQSFNIGASESVRFLQPDASSVALNRVLGSDPSRIFGSLSSNGQIFLINPNGVLFGSGASVNVGGLVASTLNLSDQDFLNGHYRFAGGGQGEVSNLGTIKALEGGYVALLGPSVNNEGTITANSGTVALAAGSALNLNILGGGLVQVAVDAGVANALATNGGLIQTDGGSIFMSAQGKDAVLNTVVNNQGILQANSIGLRNGRIFLDGGDTGVVQVGGNMSASGTASAATGGTIVATGEYVQVVDQARLDTTGLAGGGAIYIGGGWQGKDPNIRQARGVYIDKTATLDASALQTGQGGTVVAWSDTNNPKSVTRVYGNLQARGGDTSGDGGRIETSGHWVEVRGIRAQANAPHGKAGMWLLDPEDLTIGALPTDVPPLLGPVALFTSGAGTPNVLNSDIEAQLNLGTGVVLQTAPTGTGAGNITVNANISKTAGANATLDLLAAGSITMSPGVTISSSSGLLDASFVAGGNIAFSAGSSIASNGGNIVLSSTNLNNNAGAGVLNTSGGLGGRWVIYTADSAGNNYGGLASGNPDVWGQTPGTLPPGVVPAGNRYVFASPDTVAPLTTSLPTALNALPHTLTPLTPAFFNDALFAVIDGGVALDNSNQPVTGFALAPAPNRIGNQVANVTPQGTAVATISGNGNSSQANPQSGNSQGVTRLSTPGFNLPLRTSPNAGSAKATPATSPVFLRGAQQTQVVGATSSGAVVLATFATRSTPPRITATVAVGDGFRIAIPMSLFDASSGAAGTAAPQVSPASALPAWIQFDPVIGSLVSDNVPAGALPLKIRLVGSSGKQLEVTVQ